MSNMEFSFNTTNSEAVIKTTNFTVKTEESDNHCMKGGHTHNHFYNVCSRHLSRSKDRRKRLFKELIDKKTCIDAFNKGVQNPKCRESFVRAIFK